MPDVSHDFGAHLRQAREQRGVSLREIADRTKISVLTLEALERNDVSRLPGGIFTRAFVRAYAREVGLDPEDTVRRFVARFPDVSPEETPTAYQPNPERIEVDEAPTFNRAWRKVGWSLPLLLGVAYFGFGGRLPTWWNDVRTPAKAAAEPHPAVPPPPARPPVQVASVPAETLEPGAESVTPIQHAPDQAPAASPAAPATVPALSQAPPPGTAQDPLPVGSFRLTLAPREACWVSVRMGDTKVFSGLMRASERKDLTLSGNVTLVVGNAGAMSYLINDQPGRALGGPGQVVTTRLDTDTLKTLLEAR